MSATLRLCQYSGCSHFSMRIR